MPDTRVHRGMHPEDPQAFSALALPALRTATGELSYLLGRGYALASSLKLVGDRHALSSRQRAAVARCACDDARIAGRNAHAVTEHALHGQVLLVDGFNVLTTLEVALSGGIVLLGRDGAMRDIAGVHGSYRKVEETVPALALLARLASSLGVSRMHFLLDAPVSNSGRLRALIVEHAHASGWPFEACIVPDSRCRARRQSRDHRLRRRRAPRSQPALVQPRTRVRGAARPERTRRRSVLVRVPRLVGLEPSQHERQRNRRRRDDRHEPEHVDVAQHVGLTLDHPIDVLECTRGRRTWLCGRRVSDSTRRS